jgi:hypothetical protein
MRLGRPIYCNSGLTHDPFGTFCRYNPTVLRCRDLGRRVLRRTEPERAETYGAIVMIGALILLSPLFSPQYLVWILPFIAVAWSDQIITALTAFAVCATAWVAHRYRFIGHRSGELLWIVNLRNAAMIAVVAVSAARLSGLGAAYTARRTRQSRSRSGRLSTPGTWDHAAP